MYFDLFKFWGPFKTNLIRLPHEVKEILMWIIQEQQIKANYLTIFFSSMMSKMFANLYSALQFTSLSQGCLWSCHTSARLALLASQGVAPIMAEIKESYGWKMLHSVSFNERKQRSKLLSLCSKILPQPYLLYVHNWHVLLLSILPGSLWVLVVLLYPAKRNEK